MRDRLIELIKEVKFAPFKDGGGLDVSVKHQLPEHAFKAIADHLLAEGVIVPPVKQGQTIYYIHECVDRVYEGEVTSFVYVSSANSFGIHYDGGYGIFGRDVFLTREEAEKAIAERREK